MATARTGVENLPLEITVNDALTVGWTVRRRRVHRRGCQYEYITAAVAAGVRPTSGGSSPAPGLTIMAECVMRASPIPITVDRDRSAPAVHGICGNLLLRSRAGREEVIDERPRAICAWGTISPAFSGSAGAKVAVITAKDKAAQALRPPHERHLLLLRKGRPGPLAENGMRTCSPASACPSRRSQARALGIHLRRRVKLMERERPTSCTCPRTD